MKIGQNGEFSDTELFEIRVSKKIVLYSRSLSKYKKSSSQNSPIPSI